MGVHWHHDHPQTHDYSLHTARHSEDYCAQMFQLEVPDSSVKSDKAGELEDLLFSHQYQSLRWRSL